MVNDVLDRIRDVLGDADANDWVVAIVIGVLIQLMVLLIFRVVGIFFRMASWVMASIVGVLVGLWVLDRRGIPESIGGRRIDEWIDDARRAIGI
jgi:sugar phosphate permease